MNWRGWGRNEILLQKRIKKERSEFNPSKKRETKGNQFFFNFIYANPAHARPLSITIGEIGARVLEGVGLVVGFVGIVVVTVVVTIVVG